MEAPIELLKIEHNAVTKELARFRVCDIDTRCYFCREWAQLVHKRHFTWNRSTSHPPVEPGALNAGRYKINVAQSKTPSKVRSTQLFDDFKRILDEPENDNDSDNDNETEAESESSLIDTIIDMCNAWIVLPSSLTVLPSIFELIQLEAYEDEFNKFDAPKEPARLLEPLNVTRHSIILPSSGFHFLKNLTGDILLSYKEATCDHIRPDWRSPSDLEIDTLVHNNRIYEATALALTQLEGALDTAWSRLGTFLEQLCALEKERTALMGKDCQQAIDAFATQQNIVPFQHYWAQFLDSDKAKPSAPLDQVDEAFVGYLDRLVTCAQMFQSDFATPRLEAVCELVQKLWDLVVPTIRQMADRMASQEHKNESYLKNCYALSQSLEDLHPTADVRFAVDTIQLETVVRVKELVTDIDGLKLAYMDSQPDRDGRIDKINALQNRLKAAEDSYCTLRQNFRHQLTQKIFPESLFCKFSLICIEALMQEGELMEAASIEKHVKLFMESNKQLVEERQTLLEDFEEGIQTGRTELAGVIGRLLLKEGMRIQGETLAKQRQDSLLKSLGVPVNETPPASQKKKKNKKKKDTQTSGLATSLATTDNTTAASTESPLTPVVSLASYEQQSSTHTDSPVLLTQNTLAHTNGKDVPTLTSAKHTKEAKKEPNKGTSNMSSLKSALPALPVASKKETKKSPTLSKDTKRESLVLVENTKKENVKPSSDTVIPVDLNEADWQTVSSKKEAKHRIRLAIENETKALSTLAGKEEGGRSMAKKGAELQKGKSVAKNVDHPTMVIKRKDNVARESIAIGEAKVADLSKPNQKSTEERLLSPSERMSAAQVVKKGPFIASTKTESIHNVWDTTGIEKVKGISKTSVPRPKPLPADHESDLPEIQKSGIEGDKPLEAIKGSKDENGKPTVSADVSDGAWVQPSKVLESNAIWGPASNHEMPDPTHLILSDSNGVPSSISSQSAKQDIWIQPTSLSGRSTANTWSPMASISSPWSGDVNKPSDRWNHEQSLYSERVNWGQLTSLPKGQTTEPSGWNTRMEAWDYRRTTQNDSHLLSAYKTNTSGWSDLEKQTDLSNAPGSDTHAMGFAFKELVHSPNAIPSPPSATRLRVNTHDHMQAFLCDSSLAVSGPSHVLTAETSATSRRLPTFSPMFDKETLLAMSQEKLVSLLQTSQNENRQLLESLKASQQDLALLSARYSELVKLSREREAQTIQLYETQKQTDMMEARNLIMALEARIHALESQKTSPISPLTSGSSLLAGNSAIAGFNNQDLFASYRESMQRDWWLWNQTGTVPCNRCNGLGHSNTECSVHQQVANTPKVDINLMFQPVCHSCNKLNH